MNEGIHLDLDTWIVPGIFTLLYIYIVTVKLNLKPRGRGLRRPYLFELYELLRTPYLATDLQPRAVS